MSDPIPTSEIDDQLRAILRANQRSLRRIIVVLFVLLGVAGAVIGVLGYQQLTERQRIDSYVSAFVSGTCLFYVPLVEAGNQLTPKTASKLGVQLVEGSREAMHTLHCSVSLYQLPAPSPALLQAAHRYGVPLTY